MSSDPAVLFYTADFLIGTDHFNEAEVGQYIRFLCYQHQHGHLSDDFILRKFSSGLFEVVKKKLKKDRSGFWYQERMDVEINKRKNYAESRRKNVMKRYHKTDKPLINKRVKRNTYVDTYVLHMENENENENKDVNLDKNHSWKEKCKTLELYQQWELEEYEKIIHDEAWLKERDEFHRNLNILLSLKKSHVDFWSQPRGWKNIKARRSAEIDWKATWTNALSNKLNQVFKPWEQRSQETQDDIFDRLEREGKIPKRPA